MHTQQTADHDAYDFFTGAIEHITLPSPRPPPPSAHGTSTREGGGEERGEGEEEEGGEGGEGGKEEEEGGGKGREDRETGERNELETYVLVEEQVCEAPIAYFLLCLQINL